MLVVEDKDQRNNCSQYRKQLKVYKEKLFRRIPQRQHFEGQRMKKQYLNLQKEKRAIAKSEKKPDERIERMVE